MSFPPQRPGHPFAGAEREVARLGYDPNELFSSVVKTIRPLFPGAGVSVHFTSNGSYCPDRTDYSYSKQFSGIAATESTPQIGNEYRPGNVIDILCNRAGATYFASIFFDIKLQVVRFRLVKLGTQREGKLIDEMYKLPPQPQAGDEIIDEGEIGIGKNYGEIGTRVAEWFHHQLPK